MSQTPKAAMAGSKNPTFEDHGKMIQAEENEINNLLRTKEGKTLLRYLARRYDGSLVAKVPERGVDPNQTLINIGAREVVHSLRALQDRQE